MVQNYYKYGTKATNVLIFRYLCLKSDRKSAFMLNLLSSYLPISDPTWVFFIVLCIILFAPMVFGKFRIPHIVGMILAGVAIGEHGFGLLARDSSFELFGKVGIYYIMFLAGLEMDLEGLRKNKSRSLVFGLLTSLIPFVMGLAAGIWILDFSPASSLLLACILASHTLVAYPIVARYGLARRQSVIVSIAATMFALLFALLILAGLSGHYKGGSGVWFWSLLALKCVAFFTGLFLLYPMIIRFFFRKYSDPILQYIFVIAMVFFAAAMAEVCGLEGILGAFSSGLLFNRYIPRTSPLMNRVEFVGNALFIPFFLIGVGMLVNVKPMFTNLSALVVVVVMVLVGTLSKWLAAWIARRLFRYSRMEGRMLFGLTEAHAAGALAMVMVGTRLSEPSGDPLMSNAVLDGVVMMILLSCVISSLATDRAARNMALENSAQEEDERSGNDEKIMVALSNPHQIRNLMDVAIMMMNHRLNRGLIGIHAVPDGPGNSKEEEKSRKMLQYASDMAASADVRIQTQSRLAVNVTNGIIHAMRENDASELIVGLHRKRNIVDSYFGRFTTNLLNDMSRQLIIVNLLIPANTLRRIIVAVPEKAEYESGFFRWVERLARMADEIGCHIDFHATEQTGMLIRGYVARKHPDVRASYELLDTWDDLLMLSARVSYDHLFVLVTARRGTVSYQPSFENLPKQLVSYFSNNSLMIIFPEQNDEEADIHTFAEPDNAQLIKQSRMTEWLSKWIRKIS